MALVSLATLALALLLVAFVVHYTLSTMRGQRRADALVRDLLTPDEFRLVGQFGYLDVPSRVTPGRVYRIPAQPGAVAVIDGGETAMRLCLVPARPIPPREWVVVHKLLLEGAEAYYWQQANQLREYWWRGPDEAQVEVWTTRPPGVLRRC